MSVIFKTMTVIGVGLIGGSIARAAKKNGLVAKIIGVGRDESQLQKAKDLGVVDETELNLACAVQNADLIVIATPLGAMSSVFEEIADFIPSDAVITDVGSSKVSVIANAQAAFGGTLPAGFVPGHPIAGTEKNGVEASFAELFENRCTILTPTDCSAENALTRLSKLWQGMGAKIVCMDAKHHDEVLAATSHMPHVLAFALVDTLGQMHEKKEIFQFAAGGFRDFTRIASSDPTMWRDVCVNNSDALLHVLDLFRKELDGLESAIKKQDSEYLEKIFNRAKQTRDENVCL